MTTATLKIEAMHGIEDGIHFDRGEFHTNCCAWASGLLETPHGDIVASDYEDEDLNLNHDQLNWLVQNGCTLDDVDPVDHAREVFLPDGRNLADALDEAKEEAEADLDCAITGAIGDYIFDRVGLARMLRYEPACDEGYEYPDEDECAIRWANDNNMLDWEINAGTVTLKNGVESQTETFEVVDSRDNCGGSISTTDFRYYDETLCRLNDGAYIVIGSGGPMTRWAESVDSNSWSSGRGIIVPTEDELSDVWGIR